VFNTLRKGVSNIPNWCSNKLVVSGEGKEIKRFKKLATANIPKDEKDFKTDLSLASLFPEPNYIKVKVKPAFPKLSSYKTKKDGYVNSESAWWDWRVQNWGTKWDIEATLDCDEEGYLEYYFDSAWSPPVEWLQKVAKDFPELSFRLHYDEPGVGFSGIAKSIGKGEIEDQVIEY